MTKPLDLDAIETRAKAATPGPWESEAYPGWDRNRHMGGRLVTCIEGTVADTHISDDAEFIAHVRTDVPALVTEDRELRAENARLTEEVERLRERVQDFEDDFRAVVSEQCAGDEVHCSCVPHLRTESRRQHQLIVQELIRRSEVARGDVHAGSQRFMALRSAAQWVEKLRVS